MKLEKGKIFKLKCYSTIAVALVISLIYFIVFVSTSYNFSKACDEYKEVLKQVTGKITNNFSFDFKNPFETYNKDRIKIELNNYGLCEKANKEKIKKLENIISKIRKNTTNSKGISKQQKTLDQISDIQQSLERLVQLTEKYNSSTDINNDIVENDKKEIFSAYLSINLFLK